MACSLAQLPVPGAAAAALAAASAAAVCFFFPRHLLRPFGLPPPPAALVTAGAPPPLGGAPPAVLLAMTRALAPPLHAGRENVRHWPPARSRRHAPQRRVRLLLRRLLRPSLPRRAHRQGRLTAPAATARPPRVANTPQA